MQNGLKFRPSGRGSWQSDGMCLTEQDARQVVTEYRRHYSATRYRWLLEQAKQLTPFDECRRIFEEALSIS